MLLFLRSGLQKIFKGPAVLAVNIYNMDKINVMFSMPDSVTVLVGKDDPRVYEDAGVKRAILIAIRVWK